MKLAMRESGLTQIGRSITDLMDEWKAAQATAETAHDRAIEAENRAFRLHPPEPPASDDQAQKHWQSQCEAIDKAYEVRCLNEESEAAWRTVNAISKQIVELRRA